jgi:hypothetical protein
MTARLVTNWILVEKRAARFSSSTPDNWIVILQVRHGTVPHKLVEYMPGEVKFPQCFQGKSDDVRILLRCRHLSRRDLVAGA